MGNFDKERVKVGLLQTGIFTAYFLWYISIVQHGKKSSEEHCCYQ